MTFYESIRDREKIKRVRCLFSGAVQGVGFRPFIYRLAVGNKLSGFVQNRPDGVLCEVEGKAAAIDSFFSSVRTELPPLAVITNIESRDIEPKKDNTFQIIPSDIRGDGDVHIAPDTAVCKDCLAEFANPADRRFRYPFINCTNCGPRLTIIKAIPYDRANTSMACFPLCPECRSEYENPGDRRFHAEPNACPVCGPRLRLLDGEGNPVAAEDPVRAAVNILREGKILAVKGLGGFHLSVDAGNSAAVARLRSRKFREEKPLAVMAADPEKVRLIGHICAAEEQMLSSPERPIVLLPKKDNDLISGQVAPGVPHIGVMLPYTPLHHLLLENNFTSLVMTSGNQVDEPICIGNREAIARLKGIADYFLIHNRDILVRCDDSIVLPAGGEKRILRRARGFVPRPLELHESYPEVLALGPQLKATQCILKGRFAFLSPHLGDLETPQARDFFCESLALMKRITESDPRVIACDYHPAYYSTRFAADISGVRLIKVQHHHAHIASCMAENKITGDVIGLAMDGTGYGLDGNAWGGEFLVANETAFKRVGHLQYFVLPGGEKAIHEPWRIAVSLLAAAYGASWRSYAEKLGLIAAAAQYDLLDRIMENKINSPLTSGLGRLFDGVAALIGLRKKVSFEGQAAMELEGAAALQTEKVFPFEIKTDAEGCLILDVAATIRAIVDEIFQGTGREEISAAFHETLVRAFVEMSQKILNDSYLLSPSSFRRRPESRNNEMLKRVVLSGGCFQNRLLLEKSIAQLQDSGFAVYSHRQVPANDGGVSLGQAVIAGAIVKRFEQI